MNELSFRLSFVNVPCYCNRIKIIVEKQFCEIYFLAHLEYVNVIITSGMKLRPVSNVVLLMRRT